MSIIAKKIINGKSSVEYSDETGSGIEAVIYNLFVHPTERGNYHGYTLLRTAIEEITQEGYKNIFLIARPNLIKYYENYGFEVRKDSEMYLNHKNRPVSGGL